jgi:pyrimidine-specific ribonucleoside hydrolase
MRQIPVILDVDTGIDDAFALLLAAKHPALNLLGVSCVDGNCPLDQVVQNTMLVLEAAGRTDVPVAAGASRPLVAEPNYALAVHGDDGLGNIDWPKSNREPVEQFAVEFLRDLILGHPEKVTLIPVAPLTNIALLLTEYPEVKDNIEKLVIMGGSAGLGNATALAEFNIWHDPEAAQIVFSADIPTVMYGLDVFYDVHIGELQLSNLKKSDLPAGKLAGEIGEFIAGILGYPITIGDAGAVCAVIDPAGLVLETYPTAVITDKGPARGMTVVDRRPYRDTVENERALPDARDVAVALKVDSERYAKLWLETITN